MGYRNGGRKHQQISAVGRKVRGWIDSIIGGICNGGGYGFPILRGCGKERRYRVAVC